jgi:hypothetical protein
MLFAQKELRSPLQATWGYLYQQPKPLWRVAAVIVIGLT